MRIKLLSLVLLSFTNLGVSQTQFWSDDFEDAGSPSSGSRTPSSTFNASNERYFDRVTTAQTNWTTVISGVVGSKFFGGSDIDNITGQNTQSHHQSVTWSSINISGKTGLSFSGLFAIGNVTGFDHFPGSSPIDYMLVEYRIDGGAWTSILRFFPNVPNGNGPLALETTGDSLAQGEGTALGGTFAQFSGNIVGTGTLLDLRFKCLANGTTFEEVGGDNFRLFYTTALPVTISSFTSSCEDKNEVISWVSESESRFDHYELESSADLNQFKSVAIIPAIGESTEAQNYQYVIPEKTSRNDLTYYRLKMVDQDGTFKTLEPISGSRCDMDAISDLLNSYTYQDQKLILFLKEQNLSIELLTVTGLSILKSESTLEQNELTIPLSYSSQKIVLLKISNQDQSKTIIHRLFLW
ncbi:MAG: hypothetical protein A3D31_03810 [Candidatus Fluviicola riflensis]|nr:MAG: hypothetical protein CHH17_11220 [Candidatus Fluviicola riflensis]OGS79104.1 MAG: hypothetical protein A3D31_03810 [Candidatus Fluviicola riflensis]OGS86536.1 MAG: hypothetical protein A2724_03270 [Fluviicola sp. RIFCSPHIGHO2_01_FULL_43_53]OGS88989.1 MAG: hypothetical protein A3E30_01390 [Fluviicola sp. RIFCSPHIGHO2_12_FULL_43_24]